MNSRLDNLAELIAEIPGIGPKQALRLAVSLGQMTMNEKKGFVAELSSLLEGITRCKQCFDLVDEEGSGSDAVCSRCRDESLDRRIMVTETVQDLRNLIRADYKGYFHVLGGLVSPGKGLTLDTLHFQLLEDRIRTSDYVEVIFALPQNIEGQTTIMLMKSILEKTFPDLAFSRLAVGISAGSSIEFADQITISDSIQHRTSIQ